MDMDQLHTAVGRFAEAQPDAAMALLRLVREAVMDETAKHPVEDFTCHRLFRQLDAAQDHDDVLAVGSQLMDVVCTLFTSTAIPFAWAHAAAVAEKTMGAVIGKGVSVDRAYAEIPGMATYRDLRKAAHLC